MKRNKAIIVFLLLSTVSLFADMTYEGARSIAGAYMNYLMAPAIFAGLLGVGEFVAYVSRAISGGIVYVKSSSKFVWTLIISGYAINLIAVPLLALIGKWQFAFLLLIIERFGKGLRAPPRDIVLSEVTKNIGRGKGFGLHELMDQIGAVTGPLLVAWSLGGVMNYRNAFLILGFPAGISILMVISASLLYPHVHSVKKKSDGTHVVKQDFFLFLTGTFLVTAGFLHWFLAGYHLTSLIGLSPEKIALFYTIAMLVDGLLALPIGHLYDKKGRITIIVTPILALVSSLLLINSAGQLSLLLAVIFWGATMSFFETVYRAIIPSFTPENIGRGYGLYAIIQAIAWGTGSTIMGVMYQYNLHMLNYYIVITEMLALFIYVKLLTATSRI